MTEMDASQEESSAGCHK